MAHASKHAEGFAPLLALLTRADGSVETDDIQPEVGEPQHLEKPDVPNFIGFTFSGESDVVPIGFPMGHMTGDEKSPPPRRSPRLAAI